MGRVLDNHTADDLLLSEATNPETGKLKMRLQPALLKDGQYMSWPGVRWIVECDDAEDAQELKALLKLFFAAWGKYENADIRQALEF